MQEEIAILKKEIESLKNEAIGLQTKENQDDLRDYIKNCKNIQISSENSSSLFECNIDTVLSDEEQPNMDERLMNLQGEIP